MESTLCVVNRKGLLFTEVNYGVVDPLEEENVDEVAVIKVVKTL